MPGAEIEKMRYPLPNGHLDVYRQAAGKLFIFEVEFASLEDAAAYQPPPFVTKEITAVDHYTAAYLAMQQK
jgi:CYTH domain-containing protein